MADALPFLYQHNYTKNYFGWTGKDYSDIMSKMSYNILKHVKMSDFDWKKNPDVYVVQETVWCL